ncbi:MAG TPA: hypothetical protein VK034_06605 [Enhygromyxa sp.]|nr:hypothetical protein [Enhygromyxa sp.]
MLATVTLTACQPDKGPGSVVVTYVLGNSKTCEEVGVTEIEATLFRGSFEEPSRSYSERVPCEMGEVELDGVEPSNYEVRVVGFDEDGFATFDNLGQNTSQRTVEVFEAAESDFDADLTARPADLLIRWRLGDQGFGNCTGVGIARFEINAYEVGGGTLLLSTLLDCEQAGGDDGYRLVPDPARVLNGVSFGEVGIQALAADGDDVGLPATFVFDPVGAGYPVRLGIECTQAGCISE